MNPFATTPEQLLSGFYDADDHHIRISAAQGSRFAKEVAGDHNPIHDVDAPRFCVPGDLLFALITTRYGLAKDMEITFNGMLRADTPLHFPATPGKAFAINSDSGKPYVSVSRRHSVSASAEMISDFIKAYVACSGESFPGLLQPLLKAQNVMFNPDRPLVVYDSMTIHLDQTPQQQVNLTLNDARLAVNGKRGDVQFDFAITQAQKPIGVCSKKMVVSGLREYDQTAMDSIIEAYEARRNA